MFLWILLFGVLGGIGMLFAAQHFGHVVGDFVESITVQVVVIVALAFVAYGLAVPVLQERTALAEHEILLYLIGGTAGILFLLYEAGHWLHHHPRAAWAVAIIGILLVAALILARPAMPTAPVALPDVGSTGALSFWWVSIYGFLGATGMVLAGYHYGHVWGHALHSPVAQLSAYGLALAVIVGLMTPVLQQRTALSGVELWLFILWGTFGMVFLLCEVGHWLHHHHARMVQAMTVIGLGVLVSLWYTRPVGVQFSVVPPIASSHARGGSSGPVAPVTSPVPPPKPIKIGKVPDAETPCYLLPTGCMQ